MKHFLLFLTLLFVCVSSVLGERGVPFDLDTCVGRAKAIVLGELDARGEIKVTKVIRGGPELGDNLRTSTGEYTFKGLQTLTAKQGPLEVVAFLNEKNADEWQLVLQYAGIAAFDGETVYLTQDGLMNSQLAKSTLLNKDRFLQMLDASMKNEEERIRLAALPRSAERAKLLVDFILAHGQSDGTKERFRYQIGQVASALKNPMPEEQAVVLAALREAKTVREQVILLNLVEWIPLTNDTMDTVASFLPRVNPPAVREAAMNALHRIDTFKAVDYLVPYLVLDDPQLATVLQDFGSQSYPPQDQLLNIHAVEALKKLAESMKGPDYVPIENGYVIGAVSGQLCHYLHPKLLPLLYAKAVHDDGPSSAQVFSNFRSTLGLQYNREDKTSWDAWWKKAQPLLEGGFNLQTATGQDLWMDHYAQADPATQKILMNLWFFEPSINEAALVSSAIQNETAKTVLAELWRRNRLSNDAMKTIVERFITFRLVNEKPDWPRADKNSYAVRIHFVASFPFPQNASDNGRMMIFINDDDKGTEIASWKTGSLGSYHEGEDCKTIDKGLTCPSPPKVSAVVEMEGSDYPRSHDTLWKASWRLDPIRLESLVP